MGDHGVGEDVYLQVRVQVGGVEGEAHVGEEQAVDQAVQDQEAGGGSLAEANAQRNHHNAVYHQHTDEQVPGDFMIVERVDNQLLLVLLLQYVQYIDSSVVV